MLILIHIGELNVYWCLEQQLEVEEVEDESLTSIDRAVHVPPLSPNRQQSFRLPPLSPYDKFLKATTY